MDIPSHRTCPPKGFFVPRLFSWILLAGTLAFGAPVHVAVDDLSPRGVTTSDAEILGDRLRAELLATGSFRVMERGQMDQILKEQSFQKSGSCDQSECAVEIGKLLAVDRMIVGSVGKLGELYTIQARILDVQTGEIVFSANQDYEGKIEGLLSKSLPELARRLAAAVKPVSASPAVAEKPAVVVVPKPAAATVPVRLDTLPPAASRSGTKTRNWVRWGAASGAVGTGIVALLWRRESQNQKAKAEKAVAEYNTATTGFEAYKTANAQAVAKANTATTKAAVWGGISGLLATTFLVTFAF